MMKILQPPAWARPRGFANGIAVKGGTTVYIAGQVGYNGQGAWEEKGFAGQFRQALANILAVLARPDAPRVGDRSDPEAIRELFGLSKKAFKRAVGHLLKHGAVTIDRTGLVVATRK